MKPKLPQLLGICGKAGVGKDTVADHLVREHGYVKYRFADPMKKLLNERFGWTMEQWDNRHWKEDDHDGLWGGRLEDCMVATFSPRSWAQWIGTEVGRTIGGPDVWINAMWKQYMATDFPKPIVVADIRFDNEAASLWARGGDVLHIERPGAAPVEAHVSEAGVGEEWWSCSVLNDGPIDEFLERTVHRLSLLQR